VNDYTPSAERYASMPYRRCGRSGIKLPALSLGMWHNFGGENSFDNARAMTRTAFDLGITHFDLANNYGPPAGSAEETMGRLLDEDFGPFRDELIISTKAGYGMWDGPYGDFGSRKYLLSSLDQSLDRMNLDYVDVFYHHRPDPDTPLEETMTALVDAVKMGKALYVGVSNYGVAEAAAAAKFLRAAGVPLLIHQPLYNILDRTPETTGLLQTLETDGVGCIAFCPLAQGLLTGRYLDSIPADSRAAGSSVFLNTDRITPELQKKLHALNDVAKARGQSLAQMALAWVLRRPVVTSALIGASRPQQIVENVAAVANLSFTDEELAAIDRICDPAA
jgi:L-glyceraldehyde 3-phosphate reductase